MKWLYCDDAFFNKHNLFYFVPLSLLIDSEQKVVQININTLKLIQEIR